MPQRETQRLCPWVLRWLTVFLQRVHSRIHRQVVQTPLVRRQSERARDGWGVGGPKRFGAPAIAPILRWSHPIAEKGWLPVTTPEKWPKQWRGSPRRNNIRVWNRPSIACFDWFGGEHFFFLELIELFVT